MNRKLIIVDPGHGSRQDPGAIGCDEERTTEADLNLKIGLLTARLLKKAGFNVLMTRTGKASGLPVIGSTDLPSRVAIANGKKADLYLSIHCNASHYPTGKGFEVWSSGSIESLRFAKAIENQFKYLLERKRKKKRPRIFWSELKNRGIKTTRKLYVLNNTDMPAVLGECDFVSNPRSIILLKSPHGQRFFAMVYAGGVINYFKKKESE